MATRDDEAGVDNEDDENEVDETGEDPELWDFLEVLSALEEFTDPAAPST